MRKPFPILCMSLALAIATTAAVLAQAPSAAPTSVNQHIKNATALGEVFKEGEKITAAILEYDQDIDNSRLSAASFSVKDRKITRVYANKTASKGDKGANGRFVVIELNLADEAAEILSGNRSRASSAGTPNGAGPNGPGGPGGPGTQGGAGGPGGQPGANTSDRPPMPAAGMPGGGGGTRKPVKLSLSQVADIATVKGSKIAGSTTPFETNLAKNLVVDDFLQLNWKDPVTGATMAYNLYVPKNYDKNKSYPLVLFMHDASVGSPDHDRTLIQGLGAIVWATPEDQAKHPTFVLAPQSGGGGGANGGQQAPSYTGKPDNIGQMYRLLNNVVGQYNIDRKRLYTTGQSAGCMTSLAMLVEYPDLFAASMLVAGQQDPEFTAPLKDRKIWIVVSEGDFGAFPGMNASIAVWEKNGAKVVKSTWSAREPAKVQAANVAKMVAERNNIMYTAFIKGTTLPAGTENSGASEHLMSMRYAYDIPGIRDWLFQQSK